MESQIWHPSAGSVGEELIKGTMASVSISVWEKDAPSSSHPDAGQFSSSPYVSGAFKNVVSVLELRGSESMCDPFLRNCLWL